ncbi:helix-turn-helix transcriptional regulator [Fusobacterium perfoetens]|jgi:transcriptional regulator with XRE-family HTH domain|uniref:helix-turn-helix domain-containing protein n=1 Tax=Fusobacterium perfoetens TaxID=852 RepID=UPI001F3357AB|nr:helix-turn-helix transcriptional regulator [Fusobacterium perfoetens]MCF2624955.1 helix-turn-helix transcriptional regulator [Fusobacterium perfoetens]
MKSSEILINYRKNKGLTVAKFAEMLGVSQVFLTHLEHDRRKISEELFKKLETFLPASDIEILRETEQYKDVPEKIMDKLKKLEKENKVLKSKQENLDPRILNLNKRERLQFDDFMNDAVLYFQDEKVSEEDKQKLFESLQNAFFKIKYANKRK